MYGLRRTWDRDCRQMARVWWCKPVRRAERTSSGAAIALAAAVGPLVGGFLVG